MSLTSCGPCAGDPP